MEGHFQLEWTWNGFDLVAIARYIDGFHEFLGDGVSHHWVSQTWFFDLQASYDFTSLLPVETNPVPGYSKGEKEVLRGKDGAPRETASAQTSNYGRSVLDRLLRGTIITIGCNNVFNHDPPQAFGEDGNGQNYPGFTYIMPQAVSFTRASLRSSKSRPIVVAAVLASRWHSSGQRWNRERDPRGVF